MRVLYFNPAINATEGAAIHARELVKGLTKAGADVICFPEPKKNLQYAKSNERKPESGLRLYATETARFARGLWRTTSDFAHLIRIAKKQQLDFIFTRNFEYSIAGVLLQWATGLPLIVEVNALQYLERRRYGDNFFIGLRRLFEKFNLEKAHAIYVVSAELLDIIKKEHIGPKQSKVIPNGVDVDKFRPDVPAPTHLIPSIKDKCIFGFTGSLKSWHGTDVLITAFAALANERNDIALMIVGDGDEMAKLKDLAKREKIENLIVFVGRVNHADIPNYLSLIDVAVAPYLDNGDFYFSPLKVYEYMASGKPIIGSRVGQLATILAEGEFGISVKAGDSSALKAAMSKLAGDCDLRKAYARNARQLATTHSWETVARQIIDLAEKK